MRLPRFQFTTRSLMVVVAIVALGLGYGVLRGRQTSLLRTSEVYGDLYIFSGKQNHGITPPARRAHLLMLKEKYRRAARYPWLSVEPDPPERE